MALSPDIVGLTYLHPDGFEVSREEVRQYAVAVKNQDGAYSDEAVARALGHDAILAPLTFISVFGYGLRWRSSSRPTLRSWTRSSSKPNKA